MFRKRCAALILILVLACSALLTGCKHKPADNSGSTASNPQATEIIVYVTPEPTVPVVVIPETGHWHAEVLFSSSIIRETLPWYARIPLAIVLGNTAFEVDVEIENGSLSYETNTEALKEAASGTVSTIIGYFLKDLDLSLLIDRVAEAVLPETVMGKERDCYGVFDQEERDEKDRIVVTTTKGETLYFRAFGKTLVQTDEEGNQVLSFKKVKEES